MLEMTTRFGERDNGRATGGDRADLVEKTGNPVLGRLFSLGRKRDQSYPCDFGQIIYPTSVVSSVHGDKNTSSTDLLPR